MGASASISPVPKPLTAEEQVKQLDTLLQATNERLDSSREQVTLLQTQLGVSDDQLSIYKDQNARLQTQLDSSNVQNARLQKQLQDLTVHCSAQNAEVCTQNDRLRSRVCELEALLLAAPPNPVASDTKLELKCYTGITSGKNRANEQFLLDLFNRHKDSSGGLCGQNLVQALSDADAPIIPQCEEEVAEIMKQFDTSYNKTLEFGEFQQVVNAPDELQLWFSEKQLPLAANALRPLVGRSSDQLKQLSQLSPADIDHSAAAICSAIPGMLKDLHQELHGAFAIQFRIENEMKAQPSKFNDFYKMACGDIGDFHKGLTGRVGMPHLNFKNAMRQEHCERAGCDVSFTTGNYKITTTPKKEWNYVVGNELCPQGDMGYGRLFVDIKELQDRKISKDANLREEEVIAIVLYTGPMFQIYNTILRRFPTDKFAIFNDGDNLFSTTIFVLVSGIQKLCRCSRIPEGTLLYRGLGGKVDLPDIFYQVDEKGCSGYAEWGFLSTTSECNVALGYSGVKERRPKAMVMVIETSSIDRGADISEFSQYPGEKEFLYLPCSFIQRTRRGNGRVQVVDGGLVSLISVKINLNVKTQTIEELQQQKKALHLVSVKSMVAEIKYELTDCKEVSAKRGIDVSKLCVSIMNACKQIIQKHEQCDVSDYADDDTFQQLIREVFDAKTWQRARLNQVSCDFEQVARGPPLFGHGCTFSSLEYYTFANYRIFRVAFHPTAPILATASIDKTVKIWRIDSEKRTATCVATLQEHQSYVQSIAYHPTAHILATGSHDRTVKLWRFNSDCSEVTCVATMQGHSSGVLSVAFHPTEHILATGSADETAKLWQLNSDNLAATCVATLEEHKGKWYNSDHSVSSVAFHPTAPILATGSYDETVKLWRLNSDNSAATCVATLRGHYCNVLTVAFHPTAPGISDATSSWWSLEMEPTLVGPANSIQASPRLKLMAAGRHQSY